MQCRRYFCESINQLLFSNPNNFYLTEWLLQNKNNLMSGLIRVFLLWFGFLPVWFCFFVSFIFVVQIFGGVFCGAFSWLVGAFFICLFF